MYFSYLSYNLHNYSINISSLPLSAVDKRCYPTGTNTARLRFFARIDPPKSPLKRGTL